MRRKHGHLEEEAEINMTPMLDIVFIMLIFFIVTTSFVKESGLDVSRPSNAPAKTEKATKVILIQIGQGGSITMDNRDIDVRAVRSNVEKDLAGKPDATVVIVASKGSNAGTLVTVIDQARSAGAKKVSIATSAS